MGIQWAHCAGRARAPPGAARRPAAIILPVLALCCIWPAPACGTGSAQALKEEQRAAVPRAPALDPFFDELEQRTFRFFWDAANTANGLVPDRYPTPTFASIAAVGFGLTAYPI